MSKSLHTITGQINKSETGLILPHEHIFVDLRGPTTPGYAQADAADVIKLMKPHLDSAWNAGMTVLVECTPPGVGRNIAILQEVANITPMRIITPTGVYRDALTPISMRNLSINALSNIWIRELTKGIESTPIQAGFIKLAMTDDGPTDLETRNLQAAAIASQATGAVIASHTTNGITMQKEVKILEDARLNPQRFIWVHADAEPDLSYHLWAASRGAYIEIDAIGTRKDFKAQADLVQNLIYAGHCEQILLSHDAGWYEPGQPGGLPSGGVRGFTTLITDFLPYLRDQNISEINIDQITKINPFQAFAF